MTREVEIQKGEKKDQKVSEKQEIIQCWSSFAKQKKKKNNLNLPCTHIFHNSQENVTKRIKQQFVSISAHQKQAFKKLFIFFRL